MARFGGRTKPHGVGRVVGLVPGWTLVLIGIAALVLPGPGLQPPMPDWWPLGQRWWLPGGWSLGSSLILSGLLAAAFIVYSIRRFRPHPA